MALFTYRVLENDDVGDPLDHGVVRAASVDRAFELVKTQLNEILPDPRRLRVRLYRIQDFGGEGVLPDVSMQDRTLHIRGSGGA